MLDGAAWDEFRASIKGNGQMQPIVLLDGLILDGRNRARACAELGIEPITVGYTGDDPLGFVIASNLHRRHLTTRQRAAIAAEMANLQNGTNRFEKKVGTSNDVPTTISIQQAADMMSVSRPSVERAKKVMHDDPAAHAAAKAGQKPKRAPATKLQQQAEVSLQIQKMALDAGVSLIADGPALSHALRKATGASLLRTIDTGDAGTLSKVQQVIAEFGGQTLDDQYQQHRSEVATLSESAQQKLERLVARELQLRHAALDAEVRAAAREMAPQEAEAMRVAKARADAEFKKYAAMRKGLAAQISEDDYRFLRGVLHPDRTPSKEAQARAFDIVRKLDHYIEACKP